MIGEGVMTVRQWAQELGCTRARVYQMIAQARLEPSKVGAQWLLTPHDRASILARPRRKPGRPKKTVDTV